MQISNPDDREPDFLGESQHGCSEIFKRPGLHPQSGGFSLSGIPDFRAQYEQNVLQWQKGNTTAGPPEVSQPPNILSRVGSIQACESEISQDSHFFFNPQPAINHFRW